MMILSWWARLALCQTIHRSHKFDDVALRSPMGFPEFSLVVQWPGNTNRWLATLEGDVKSGSECGVERLRQIFPSHHIPIDAESPLYGRREVCTEEGCCFVWFQGVEHVPIHLVAHACTRSNTFKRKHRGGHIVLPPLFLNSVYMNAFTDKNSEERNNNYFKYILVYQW